MRLCPVDRFQRRVPNPPERRPQLTLIDVGFVAPRSNLLCHVDLSRHWKFEKHTVRALTLHLDGAPQVRGLSNWREVVGGKIVPLAGVAVSRSGADVALSGIKLDDQMVVRWLVADVAFDA